MNSPTLIFILFFTAISLPVFAGWLFVRRLGIARNRFELFLFSFLFGWLFFGAIFALAGFAEVGFSLTGGIFIIFILWGSYLLFCYIRSSSNEADFPLLFSGLLLLAGGVSVKNEGLIYFTIALVFVIMMHLIHCFREISESKSIWTVRLQSESFKELRKVIFAISVSLFFILSWLLFRYYLNIGLRDFSVVKKVQLILKEGFLHSGSSGILRQSIAKFANAMFIDVTLNCGLWYLLLWSLLTLRKRLFKAEYLFLLSMIFVPVAIFAVSFIFSTRQLYWHLDSVPRLLLCPMLFSWLFSTFCISQQKTH